MKNLFIVLFTLLSFNSNAQETQHFECSYAELWRWDSIKEDWTTTYKIEDPNYNITLTKTNILTINAKKTQVIRLFTNTEKITKRPGRTSMRYEAAVVTDNDKEVVVVVVFDTEKGRIIFQVMDFTVSPFACLNYITQMVIE